MKSSRCATRALCLFSFCLGAILASPEANATIIVDGLWRLGENDPGAVAGNTVTTTTVAAIGGLDLNRQNGTSSITYSSDAAPNSTLSVNFNVNPYYSANSVVSTATDNFGYEIWIKPASGQNGDRNIFGSDQIALIVNGNEFRAVYQGIAVLDPAGNTSVSSFYDQWVDLAVVRSAGVSTLYLNGTAFTLSPNTSIPNIPANQTFISQANGTSIQRLDEARIFHFSEGQFQVTDLLYFVPEPSSISLLVIGLLGLVRVRRRRSLKLN